MNIIREIPKIRQDFLSLRGERNDLDNLMSEKWIESNAMVENLKWYEKLYYTIKRMDKLSTTCKISIKASLKTDKANRSFTQATKALARKNNPYCTAKKGTLNEVFSDCFTTMNLMKLEIGLVAIKTANGDIKNALRISEAAIRSLPATDKSDMNIFSTALAIAKDDGVKLVGSLMFTEKSNTSINKGR